MMKGTRIGGLVAVDILAVILSISTAFALDLIDINITPTDVVVSSLMYVFIMHKFRAYTCLWEKAGMDEMLQLALATFSSSVMIRVYLEIRYSISGFTSFALGTMMMLMISGGARFAYRALRHLKNRTFPALAMIKNKQISKVLIIGAGDTARVLLKDMAEGNTNNYKPMAIIDDDAGKHGMHLNGVRIIGGRDLIEKTAARYKVDLIIVAIPSASRKDQSEILRICNRTGKKVRMLPGMIDMISGHVNVGKMREVRLEDLLGREPVKLDEKGIAEMLDGSTILITGGAGSIGSELARQCLRFSPKRVVIVDLAENKMYMLAHEVARMNHSAEFITLVGSVRDEGRINAIFNQYKPDIVFHAAAHKHVPLMEDCASEAVKNNICGTSIVTKAAIRHETKRFVFISTDKAVNPTSVMGASKRFCELLIGSFETTGSTKFASVRFGNVLGSDGSVVPIFTEQIKSGGPVTVTHPEVTRYFMLISEAVQLVLQSASMMEGNELFAPLGAASAEVGVKYDHYLLLVIEASSPAARGWAEPIVLSHDRAGKVIIADSLDCNDLYTVGGKQVKMGNIYSIGGENLVMSIINVSFGLGMTKYAKTTYKGLDHVARIMGGSLNVGTMIEASKSSDRSTVRKEQLRFIEAMSYGLHNLSLTRMFALFKASFSYCDSNINIWEAFNLTRDLIGGTFIPRDGKELAISL